MKVQLRQSAGTDPASCGEGSSDGPAVRKDGLDGELWARPASYPGPARIPSHKPWWISSLLCVGKTCHFVDCSGSEACSGNGIVAAFPKLSKLSPKLQAFEIRQKCFMRERARQQRYSEPPGFAHGLHTLHLSDLTRRHNQDLHGKPRLLSYTFWEPKLTTPFTSVLFPVLHSQPN